MWSVVPNPCLSTSIYLESETGGFNVKIIIWADYKLSCIFDILWDTFILGNMR